MNPVTPFIVITYTCLVGGMMALVVGIGCALIGHDAGSAQAFGAFIPLMLGALIGLAVTA